MKRPVSQSLRFRRALFLALPVLLSLLTTYATDKSLQTFESVGEFEGVLEDGLWLKLPRIEPDERIVLVTVQPSTEATVHSTVTSVGIPRSAYSKLFKSLDRFKASVLVIDVDFHDQKGPGNPALREALASLANCMAVLGDNHVPDDDVENPDTPGGIAFKYEALTGLLHPNVVRGAVENYEPSGVAIGCVPYRVDAVDGQPILHLAVLSAALAVNGDFRTPELSDDWTHLRIGQLDCELGVNQAVLARWTQKLRAFKEYSFEAALNMTQEEGEDAFKGKIVLIGDARPFVDQVESAAFDVQNGVYYNAQLINTFLMPRRDKASWLPDQNRWVMGSILSLLASGLALSGKRWLVLFGPSVVFGVACIAPIYVIARQSLVLEPLLVALPPLLSSLVCYALLAFKLGPLDHRIPGEIRIGTVLFVDVKGSTELTRAIGGREYQRMFVEFMEKSAPLVNAAGGQVERTLGDGFVALFSSTSTANTALAAFNAALQVKTVALETGAAHDQMFAVKAALENGPVTGGFVPEHGARAWSTSGNTINMAARLLESCSNFAVDLAIGPVAAAMLAEDVRLEVVGKLVPKGFDQETSVYSPVP